jgi:glyoxylase-like metal-dependent hydrolase (beta-lactamase superfamily II)
MILVPDAKVIATGDVLVAPIPYDYDGYGSEWIAVLKKVSAMDPLAIVPGHGPVMRDRKYLDRVVALLQSIQDQVRGAYSPGATLDEIRKKVDLDAFRREFAGDDPQRNFVFTDAIAGPGVQRAYEEIQFSVE